MVTTIKKHIGGVQYEFWTHTGTVVEALQKSETTVTSSGGGGYVGPNGGHVSRPVVSTRTHHWQKVRVDGDDGRAYTVDLHDEIAAFAGDRVSLIYARASQDKDGRLHGFKNHREDYWWWFNCEQLVKPQYRVGLEGLIFRLTSNKFIGFALLLVLGFGCHVLYRGGKFYIPGEWPLVVGWALLLSLPIQFWYALLRKSAARRAEKLIETIGRDLDDRRPPG